MAIATVFERAEWAQQAGAAAAYAPLIRKRPLPGQSAKPIIFQMAKGDKTMEDAVARRLPDFSRQNFQQKGTEQYALDFKITGSNDHPKTDLAEKLMGGSVKEKVEDLISGFFGTKPKPKEKEKESKDSEKKKDKSKSDTPEAPKRQ